jgi:galactose mutarotase-like enzyme
MTLAIAYERLLYCGRFHEVGVNAPGLVRLVLKADTFTVDVLPALGGKIASIRKNGIELLQQPLLPYAPRTLETAFEDSDASGFDECLPSVSACEIDTPPGKVAIPDHGEFWRLPCEVQSQTQQEVHLSASGTILPLRFERNVRIESDSPQARSDTLRIDYKVENTGQTELHYGWSAHPLFAVDPGDRILLPDSVREVTVEGSARNRLGSKGTVHSWPNTKLGCGEMAELDRAGNVSDDIGDKIYTAAPPEGWCAIARSGTDARVGLRVQVEFDPALSPFLGLWLCYGGWPEGRAKRQCCVALEPCTAPEDSLAAAIADGWARTLVPGQCDLWWMRIVTTVVS